MKWRIENLLLEFDSKQRYVEGAAFAKTDFEHAFVGARLEQALIRLREFYFVSIVNRCWIWP